MKHLKFISILILSLVITTITKGQSHWESLILETDTFKYLNPESEPAVDWPQLDFDDAAWDSGIGGFGYEDGDDNTIIATPTTSIYLRKVLDMPASVSILQLVLDIDYDDAFVAYINGVEVARSQNLQPGTPAMDGSVTFDHEAQMYSGGSPERFILDPAIINEGNNIIALHILNYGIASSDLSARVFLSAELETDQVFFHPTPTWFREPVNFDSSNLPIIKINTEGATIVDEPKITARMQIINNSGDINRIDDTNYEYDGYIGIEIRGNSTANFPKKPYSMETRDANGENLNVSLLGMPAENDWILRASYLDHTFIRNSLANYMARQTGYWASRTRHIELWLNGEYQGIYILMEKIKRDDNRLDISRLDSTEITGEDITGGYIWEITGFDANFGESRKIKYPDFDDIHPDQLAYIKSVDDAFRAKMRSSAAVYSDPNTGYVEHIWTESFLYEVLVQEAMRNSDAYGWSGYYHKDKNELINAGPVWDFDQSAGNSSYPDNGVITDWLITHPYTSNTPFYWPLLLSDPFFKYSLSLRWKELRSDRFSNNNLVNYIDSIAAILNEPQAREFSKWPVLGANIWRETTGYNTRDTYQKEVDYMTSFLIQRWQWLDTQLRNVQKPDGYPEILINGELIHTSELFSAGKKYIDLDELFSYPYLPELKYEAFSNDTNIVFTDVKKTDSVKFELRGIGLCEITLNATDNYGNKKDTTFTFEVLDGPSFAMVNPYENYKISIYPNPASEYLVIQMANTQSSIVNIDVYGITGQKIDNMYSGGPMNQFKYNCSNLTNGIYVLRITTSENNVFTKKLVIRK